MARRDKKKSKGSKGKKKKGKKKESKWVNLGSLNESENYTDENGDPTLYFKASDYKGKLMWYDETSEKYYEVITAALFDPHEDAPDFVKHTIAVNIKNEKCAVCLDDDDDDSGDDDEEED